MRTAHYRSLTLAMFAAFVPFCSAQADPLSDLDDAAARIQYAFHTGDARGIEDALGIVQRVQLPESRKGMKEYFSAYAYWKLAETHADAIAAGAKVSKGEVTKAAAACVKAAQAATTLDARLGEGYAIEAACSALASRTPEMLSLGGCARHRALRTARELEPNNPRIRLIEAECSVGEKGGGSSREQLLAIVKLFEGLSPASPGRPDWGQPEAWLLLGQTQLRQGDATAARDSLERALVLAPDYRKAREALAASKSR